MWKPKNMWRNMNNVEVCESILMYVNTQIMWNNVNNLKVCGKI